MTFQRTNNSSHRAAGLRLRAELSWIHGPSTDCRVYLCCAVIGLTAWLGTATVATAADPPAPPAVELPAVELPAVELPAVELPAVELPEAWHRYQIEVSLTFASAPHFTPSLQQAIRRELVQKIESVYGAMWNVSVIDNPDLFPPNSVGLSRMAPPPPPAPDDNADDKSAVEANPPHFRFHLTVESSGGKYLTAGRMYCSTTQRLSGMVTGETLDRAAIAWQWLARIRELFAPVGTIEQIVGRTVIVNVHGGTLPPADPAETLLQPGDLLEPCFRYLDSQRIVRRIQFVPWTYLMVEKIERGRAECTLISSFRSPLGTGRSSRRLQLKAVRLNPRLPHTRVQLAPRSSPEKPLIAHNVTIIPKKLAADEPLGPAVELLTDRTGSITVPRDPEHPLMWMYVNSGDALMARVPFVPGITAEASLLLGDDSVRLAVEGEVELLRGRLIDAVARRATLLIRARQLAEAENWENVDRLLARLKSIRTVEQFESQLNAIRQPALETARSRGDRGAQARVTRLCNETSELIKRYLDQDKARAIVQEIEELRKIGSTDP